MADVFRLGVAIAMRPLFATLAEHPPQCPPSRIAVVGSRDFSNSRLLTEVMDGYLPGIKLLISGGARGADTMGEQWAKARGIETRIYRPEDHGGFHARNRLIVAASELVVAFWNGHSTGTRYTVNYAKSIGVLVRIVKP